MRKSATPAVIIPTYSHIILAICSIQGRLHLQIAGDQELKVCLDKDREDFFIEELFSQLLLINQASICKFCKFDIKRHAKVKQDSHEVNIAENSQYFFKCDPRFSNAL